VQHRHDLVERQIVVAEVERREAYDEVRAADERKARRRMLHVDFGHWRLLSLGTEVDDEHGFDAEEIDRDLIAERLKEDAAESKGKLYRQLAEELEFGEAKKCIWRWNSDVVTGVALNMPWAYTVSKDLGLVKWRLQELPENQWLPKNGKKTSKKPKPPPKRKPERVAFVKGDRKKSKDNLYQGHVDNILCVSASQDGKFVVTGGKDKRIIVWDTETLKCLRVFTQHRDAVTGLAFRRSTNQLYSSSKDRTIKIWDYLSKSCVQTMEGHTNNPSFAVFHPNLPIIISGSEDGTVKIWNSNTYRLENTLSYALERAWCVSLRRDANEVAVGFDEGIVVIKVGLRYLRLHAFLADAYQSSLVGTSPRTVWTHQAS